MMYDAWSGSNSRNYDNYLENLGYLQSQSMPIKEEKYALNFSIKPTIPDIERVIFSYPATIVLWSDHTKTVVKVKEGEKFDKWTGLSMCICKKLYGDKFHSVFKKHCKDDEPISNEAEEESVLDHIIRKAMEAFRG